MSNGDSQFLGQEVFSIGGGDAFSGMIPQEPTLIEEKPKDKKVEPDKKVEKEEKTELGSQKSDTKSESSNTKEQIQEKSKDKKPESETNGQEKSESKTSPAFILAESYKKDGILGEDIEIPEDITAKDLKQLILKSALEDAQKVVRSEYEETYGSDLLKTADLIRQGIDPEDIKDISLYKRLSSAKLGENEDDNYKIKEAVIKSMYQDKGLSEKKINKLFDDSMDEDEGEAEFADAKKYFYNKALEIERSIEENAKNTEKENLSKQEIANNNIKSAIKSGEIYGVTTEKEKRSLEKFLFEQDEVIKVDGKQYRVTGFQKALQDYNSDIKKQVTFAKLLMDGFNLSNIEEIGKSKATDELDELLEGSINGKSTSKEVNKSEKTPNWLEGLIEL